MSGGSYDYVYSRMRDAAETLRREHPQEPHVVAFADLLERMSETMYKIEWCDSGDSNWSETLDQEIRGHLGMGAELAVTVERAEAAVEALQRALQAARA